MHTKAVIFDFDGVILDTRRVVTEIYKIINKELRLNVSDHLFESGDFFVVNWNKTLENLGITDTQDIQKAVAIYLREYERLKNEIKLYDGILEAIKILVESYKLAIVSNSHLETIKETLRKFKLLNYFDCVVGVDYGAMKPDPTPILKCLDKLHKIPEEAVYIGDMAGDVQTARNAKLKKAIAVTWGFHSETRLKNASPDLIISTPKELIDAVI